MSLLTNALTVGRQDEFTLVELKDTVLAYAKGEVPEVVSVLSKEDMDKYKKASPIEKVDKTYSYLQIFFKPKLWVKLILFVFDLEFLNQVLFIFSCPVFYKVLNQNQI